MWTDAARLLDYAFGLTRLRKLSATDIPGAPLAALVLDRLNIRLKTLPSEIARIPRAGATLVVANHPTGILDGAALAKILCEIRPDVKILANDLLANIANLRDLIVPVNVFSGSSPAMTREAVRHLASGGLLVIFPAGEVAHRTWTNPAIRESVWNDSPIRLARMTERAGVPVDLVCAHIDARNRERFYAAGLIHPLLRTAMLPGEFLAMKNSTVRITFRPPLRAEQIAGESPIQQTAALRARCDARITREINALPADAELERSGDLRVFLAPAYRIPCLLREIGRLREISFREVGEGTGNDIDLDTYDTTYEHLFLWNDRKEEVAGAYRLRRTRGVHASDLYTARLFGYDMILWRRWARP